MFALANTASSPVTFFVPTLVILIVALKVFTEYWDLMLDTADLTAGSHLTILIAITIWVHELSFISWLEPWKWMYQIQSIDTQRACNNNLVRQKIRSLDAMAKSLEKISEMLKKDFVYLYLEKKELKDL